MQNWYFFVVEDNILHIIQSDHLPQENIDFEQLNYTPHKGKEFYFQIIGKNIWGYVLADSESEAGQTAKDLFLTVFVPL